MFNRIVKDFAKEMLKNENALDAELINMVDVGEKHTDNKFGNGLFEVSRQCKFRLWIKTLFENIWWQIKSLTPVFWIFVAIIAIAGINV